jgi:Arc/MetJ family transcription regulator
MVGILIATNGVRSMRATLDLDDDLIARAQEYTGLTQVSALVHEALKTLVAVEAGRRLARMGGIAPDAKAPRRRRQKPW